MKIAHTILVLISMLGLLSACSTTDHYEAPGQLHRSQQPCLDTTTDDGTETDGGIGGTGHAPDACSEPPDPT